MGTTYLHAVSSLDGYIADEHDDVGPLHDWYFNGDHPSSEGEIGVGAGDVGGQALSLGLIDHVAIDIVPVDFGRGKPYFGRLADGHLMLEDPEVVIQGDGVPHLRYPVKRER